MALVMSVALFACKGEGDSEKDGIILTDHAGNTAYLTKTSRVVSCYASLTDCWLLAGGEVVGVTDDCEERGIIFENSPAIIGSTKVIDVEKIVSLDSDYVIMSYDLTAQRELEDVLESMQIPYGYFRVDTFEDYEKIMSSFTSVTGRKDLYEENVSKPKENISRILSEIPDDNDDTFLLLRAYSTGMKVKRDDNLAGLILNEMHLTNIADLSESILEELSMEKILLEDPEYIFISTMGDEEAAKKYISENISSDPVWQSLSAVKEGRVFFLPQELFHYKPNEKWDESYEYIRKILYPEVVPE